MDDLVVECQEKLTRFRIQELKDVLSQLRLAKTGRKQELMDRILALLIVEEASDRHGPLKNKFISKEDVAKIIDQTYRKLQPVGTSDSLSGSHSASSRIIIPKEESVDQKIRCPCGSPLKIEPMIQCADRQCHVLQHVSCVRIPVESAEESAPAPSQHYCETCRIDRCDPFTKTLAYPLSPVKLNHVSSIADDGSQPLQNIDASFQITKADVRLLENAGNDVQFTMELLGTETGRVPKCYSMDMSTDFIPMSVFSESKQGRVSVEGKIYHKFDMKPHNENIEEYGKLCRERTNKYMTKTRQIQVIDNDNGAHMRPMPGLIALRNTSQTERKKGPVKGSDTKRTRRDRGEMEDIMFKLFERQSNWTLKQLISETDQPEQFLKDMLKDLCIYNNKGSNQGTYELKPEYKRSTDEQEPTSK